MSRIRHISLVLVRRVILWQVLAGAPIMVDLLRISVIWLAPTADARQELDTKEASKDQEHGLHHLLVVELSPCIQAFTLELFDPSS